MRLESGALKQLSSMSTVEDLQMMSEFRAIAAGLNAIAAALQQLTATLSEPRQSRTNPKATSLHPLWYLEVLEQACSQDWQLTTEEVEQIIGVNPHCHKEVTDYERGNWGLLKSASWAHKLPGRSVNRLK